MDEDPPSIRFATFSSGATASQLVHDSCNTLRKNRNSASDVLHDLSQNGREEQQPSHVVFGKSKNAQICGTGMNAGDIIRRNRFQVSRTSLLDGIRLSSPLPPMSVTGNEDEHTQRMEHEMPADQTSRCITANASQPREFVKLRTSKSMHQRPDSTSSRVVPSPRASLHPRSVTHRPANPSAAPHPATPSRSASVASFVYAQAPQEDDIPSIMMRGANDLRNAKFEIEELRHEVTVLHSQIESTKLEKDELSQRLGAVKDAAKNGFKTTSQSLESMRLSMEGLKKQSENSFAVAAQVKAALPDIKELKETVALSVKGIESAMSEDGHLFEVARTKGIIDELKLECSGSSQVIDILREKLQSIGSELVDAKNRVSDLETVQAADREALRASSANLTSSSEQTRKLIEEVKDRDIQLNRALVSAADLENRLTDANVQIQELNEVMKKKDLELESLSVLQTNLGNAQLVLKERENQINDLKGLQARLDGVVKDSTDNLTRTRILEASIILKDETIENLEARIITQENQLRSTQETLEEVRRDSTTLSTREAILRQELAAKEGYIGSMKDEQANTQDLLNDTRKELEQRTECFHRLQSEYQVMEERFETQLVTAKCAQETQAELQERLVESQARHARELEAVTGKRDSEIAVLSEQRTSLSAKLGDLETSALLHREELATAKADYNERIAKLEDARGVQLELAEKRVSDAHAALQDARAAIKNNEEQVAFAKQEILTLREELREARLPSPAHKEAVDALTAQITALRLENTELVLRARSIDSRYRAGDLNEEEKTFINTLVQTSQSIHEQELISKGNELRRRGNVIKEQQARIQSLEATLTKQFKAQGEVTVIPAADNHSLIDPKAWASSSDKGCSHPQVIDEDIPSTNVDNTVTAKPTPAPARPSSRAPLGLVPQPDPNTKPRPTRTPARLLRLPPAGAPTSKGAPVNSKKAVSSAQSSSPLVYPQPKTPAVRGTGAQNLRKLDMNAHNGPKAMFSRLASDGSDEIVDFEEKSRKPSPIGTPPEANAAERMQSGRTRLGKRDKPASSPESGPNSAKRPRRLRSHMRSRPVPQQDGPVQKNVEPQAKIRTKNRGY